MKTKIIADLTSNHMGKKSIIEAMIKTLSENGVDIVKTQSWQAKSLKKDIVEYEKNYDYYLKHQLSDNDHWVIKEICDKHDIEMLTTCFDLERIEFLSSLGLKSIKVASSDSTSYKMIESLLNNFENVIISTGGTEDDELNDLIKICQGKNVTFLHCVSLYPCPLEKVNMDRMVALKKLGLRFGYSDHTMGTEAAKYAICLGAEYVEKHFTLNRALPGRDQKMSTTIEEFSEIVEWANLINKMKGVPNPILSKQEHTFRENYIGKWGKND
jgi:sialic acid synthase SpsE